MGSSESKINKDDKESPSTPMQCTKSSNFKNVSKMDPRSPNGCITRTPIEVPIKSTCESEIENITQVEHATDPRSPTDLFTRTPIYIQNTTSPQPPLKLHNKILDNAKRSITYTPTLTTKIHKDFEANIVPIQPKLLDSSPISRKNTDNRKSFVGLLETNIDYTETDLDIYIKTKSLNSSLTINVNENFVTSGNIIKQESCDPRSPSTEFLRTPIQIVKKIGEVDLNNTVDVEDENWESKMGYDTKYLLKIADMAITKKMKVDKYQETLHHSTEGILQKNVSVEKVPDEIEAIDGVCFSGVKNGEIDSINLLSENDSVPSEEIVHIVKSLVDHVEALTMIEIHKIEESTLHLEQEAIKEPVIDLTADVQEFDRKLTKIIYEDEETFTFKRSPKNDKDEKPRNRTPMKDRNVILEPKKNKLRVSDKPRKLDYTVSKIPVYREKNVQCENTIPVSMDVRKKKKSHMPKWDSDKTLVI